MATGDAIPAVPVSASVMEAIREISRKRLGMTAVLEHDGRVAGIFTDGDLRRLLERGASVRELAVAEVMTRNPLTIGPDALAAEAAQLIESTRRNQLLVVRDGRLVGALHAHDLTAARVL
jgi:arabinose-5-phosphate isomerase